MQLRGTVRSDRPLLVVALDEEAERLDDSLPVLITGVGKLRAGTAVTSVLLQAGRPESVINIGTAGALAPGLEGIHEIAAVIQHDFDDAALFDLLGQHFGAPLLLGDHPDEDCPFTRALPRPVLATGDRFVAGGHARAALATQADLVDMEGYAVAAACRGLGVPVRLVKLVSDAADEDASQTWADSVAYHAHTLADWVLAHI
jgi:adenosylhomocysteine nucleosidase